MIKIKGEKYYKTGDVAKMLKFDVTTIRRWIKSGKLESTKLGRGYIISESSIKKLLDSGLDTDAK